MATLAADIPAIADQFLELRGVVLTRWGEPLLADDSIFGTRQKCGSLFNIQPGDCELELVCLLLLTFLPYGHLTRDAVAHAHTRACCGDDRR